MARLNCILVLSLKQKEWLPGHSEHIVGYFNLFLYWNNICLLQNCKATGKGFYAQSCYCTECVQLWVRKKLILKGKNRRLWKEKRSNFQFKVSSSSFYIHVLFQTSWRSFYWDTLKIYSSKFGDLFHNDQLAYQDLKKNKYIYIFAKHVSISICKNEIEIDVF